MKIINQFTVTALFLMLISGVVNVSIAMEAQVLLPDEIIVGSNAILDHVALADLNRQVAEENLEAQVRHARELQNAILAATDEILDDVDEGEAQLFAAAESQEAEIERLRRENWQAQAELARLQRRAVLAEEEAGRARDQAEEEAVLRRKYAALRVPRLVAAAADRNLRAVILFLNDGDDINIVNPENGYTALREAINHYSKTIVEYLIQRPGINLNPIDIEGMSPLRAAAFYRDNYPAEPVRSEIVALLEAKAAKCIEGALYIG